MTDLNPVDAMTNPYRAMCAELIERLEWFIAEDETNENDPGNQYWLTGKQAGIDSVARARALLAQPGPPELTRDELLRCAKIATPDYSNHWGRELEMMRAAITADRARALLAQPVAEGPTIPSSKLHRQELTPLEITLLIEALDFAIGDIKARPNSSNHVAVRAKLKRSISRPKATND